MAAPRKVSQETLGALRDFSVTSSVAATFAEFEPDRKLTAWDLLRRLLKRHPEYGGHKAKDVLARQGYVEDAEIRTVSEWGDSLAKLFDPDRARPFHGRLVVLGLALLSEELRTHLDESQFVSSVHGEVREPIETLLRARKEAEATARRLSDNPPFHADGVAMRDQLARKGFARMLARRLRLVWEGINQEAGAESSYVVQLDGPWGSGKSTLLRFLREELEQPSPWGGDPKKERHAGPWLVVEFDAWRQQRLAPPWWPFLDGLYQAARKTIDADEAVKLRRSEERWRREHLSGHESRKLAFTAAIFGLLLLGAFVLLSRYPAELTESVAVAKPLVELGSGVIGLLLTVWGIAQAAATRWTGPSPESARRFEELTEDPMGELRLHFADLIQRIQLPVAIFVDNLDRCRADYVVSLLEGIQTLFSHSRVVYVVAADRRWLSACFEQQYARFRQRIREPARPLGRLFLEKAFQLEVSVPGITSDLKRSYLDHLLTGDGKDVPARMETLRQEAELEFAQSQSAEDVLNRLAKPDPDPLHEQARREAAVVQLASEKVEEETEQFLLQFEHLMESNPRSMKRLLQAYGINLAVVTLRDPMTVTEVRARTPLVLWTILTLRWPELAEHLARRPNDLPDIKGPGGSETLSVPLRPVAATEAVQNVLHGHGVGAQLEPEVLEELVRVLSPRA